MKKSLLVLSILTALSASVFSADLTAKFITTEAAKKDTVEESIAYMKARAAENKNPAEKRAVYICLASLQEQMSMFDDAQKSYAIAAGISAGDAAGMPKKTNEQIVLDAVRCALSCGDSATADSYLNSAVRNSKNETVQAYIKLYTQWSSLCKANSVADLQEAIVMLQAYSKLDSMKAVQPAILLTLWYITGDKSYSLLITSKFPSSIEAAVVKGDAQFLPTPFWFFVPKSGEAEQGSGTVSVSEEPKTVAKAESASESPAKFSKWQLGLFRTESNAKVLAEEVRAKGFDSYITKETRASGNTYFVVLVKEDKTGNVAERLRSAGYDCYAVD